MKLDRLLQHGIPQSIIQSWKQTQGEKLLPLQARAVADHGLLQGESLIISAPTSSGKTFCGEMAAVVNLFKRMKVVFLVPLKAIAEEKYSEFTEKYARLGIRVVISTRDRQEYDREVERGDFDLAIMIYEKFNQLLIRDLDLLKLISLVVVDELQMIADPSRGAVLELALLKMINSGYKPQILGLSAVLQNADQLASWLGCRLLQEKSRPVELLQGVLLDGEFRFKKHNTGEEGSEKLADLESDQNQDILFANMQRLLSQGEQVLVFLKSKKTCEDCALSFAEQSRLAPSLDAVEALSPLENTTLKESLILCLKSGVAFHDADLSFDERRVVEHFYLKGDIRAIFSTTTLSLGINLPAKTVFIETQKYDLGEHSGKALPLPITWSEYENMSGRAGRFGLQEDFGRAIVIAQNSFQFDCLWEEYVEGREGSITSQLSKKDQADVVLDLVASGSAVTLDQLEQAMNSGLGGRFIPHLREKLESTLQELEDEEILIRKGECYSPTRLGMVCAQKGISVQTGLHIKKRIQASNDPEPFGWLYRVLDTKDGRDVYVNVSFWEQQNQTYERALTERFGNSAPPEEIGHLMERNTGLSPGEIRLVKICCLLAEWIESASTLDLEEKYLCRSGQIEQIAHRTGWLLDSAWGLARAMKSPRRLVQFLRKLSLRVDFGVEESGIALARLRAPGLGRDYLQRLIRAGLTDVPKLRSIDPAELERVLPHQIAVNLLQAASQRRKRKKLIPVAASHRQPSGTDEPDLVIDGAPVKDRFLVMVNERKLTLPAKSFKYLVKLAWTALSTEDGWIHKSDFEPGENQTRYLHRLKKQIAAGSPSKRSLIENNRLGCYRLSIPRERIRINRAALAKNADKEIQDIAQSSEVHPETP
jgi:helicase